LKYIINEKQLLKQIYLAKNIALEKDKLIFYCEKDMP
jgi:hypothetical protein